MKLASHDPTWRNLSALDFHYWTQPLPTVVAWYADKLPRGFQHASTFMVLAIELGAPFLIFAPRRIRFFGAGLLLGLQALIFLTGNYTFFNLLSAAITVFLFDDQWLRGVVWTPTKRIREWLLSEPARTGKVGRLAACGADAADSAAWFRADHRERDAGSCLIRSSCWLAIRRPFRWSIPTVCSR